MVRKQLQDGLDQPAAVPDGGRRPFFMAPVAKDDAIMTDLTPSRRDKARLGMNWTDDDTHLEGSSFAGTIYGAEIESIGGRTDFVERDGHFEVLMLMPCYDGDPGQRPHSNGAALPKPTPTESKQDNVADSIHVIAENTRVLRDVSRRMDEERTRIPGWVRALHGKVLAWAYDQRCPCCRGDAPIVDTDGSYFSNGECDHFWLRSKSGKHETWPICKKCHIEKTVSEGGHEWAYDAFVHYQEKRRDYERQFGTQTTPFWLRAS